jgi:hypothetical protein
VFLFRSRLFRAGGLLDVDYQLALRFVLVDWPGRIVDFIILERTASSSGRPLPRPRETKSAWEIGELMSGLHRFNRGGRIVEVGS